MRGYVLATLCAATAACGVSPPPAADDGPRGDAVRAYTQAGLLVRDEHLPEAAELYDRAASLDPSSAQVWLAGARVRSRLHQYPEAITRGERALALSPNHIEVVDVLGSAYLAMRRLDDAHRLYAEFVQRRPEPAVGWAGLAAVASARREYETAERTLVKAVERAPEVAEYWARLGIVRRRLNRPAAAAQALDRAALLHPGRRVLDQQIFELAIEGGDFDVARSAAERLKGPEKAELHVARELLNRKDLVGAAGQLERLLARDASRHDARLLLAGIHARVERLLEAAALLAEIPADVPEWVDAQRLHGWIHSESGDMKAAVERLEAASKAAPDRVELVLELARALRANGDLKAARARLAASIERWPAHHAIRYQHAMVVHEMGDEAAALRAMFGVLSVEPDHPGALNFIGYTWTEQGKRLERAEAFIRRALAQNPTEGAIVDSLGWVLFKRGRLDDAEATLRRAVSLAPEQAEIHFHLAEVLWAAGRKKEARKHYDSAIAKTRNDDERKRYEARRRARAGRR